MRKHRFLLSAVALSFVYGVTVPAVGQPQETTRSRGQELSLSERAAAAREEAEIAREAAELAEQRARLAERQLELARKKESRRGEVDQLQAMEDLGMRETDRGLVLTLEDVVFELGEANLRPTARRKLSSLVSLLEQYPNRPIVIEGHTDNTGSATYNHELSHRRAEAVREYLVDNGISTDRIVTRGYGQKQPIASNRTEEGRQQNRRVEIIVPPNGERVAEGRGWR